MPITDPTDISGCIVWLDATNSGSFTLSGSDVIEWADLSGNGNDFDDVGNSSIRPERQAAILNGLHGVYFDEATGDQLQCTNAALTAQPLTVVCLHRFDGSAASGWGIYGKWGGAGSFGVRYDNISGDLYTESGFPDSLVDYPDYGDPHWIINVYDGANSDQRLDGAAAFTNVNIGTSAPDDAKMNIGKHGFGGQLEGWIFELVVYDSALSSGDQDDLDAYILAKWFGVGGGAPPVPFRRRTIILN